MQHGLVCWRCGADLAAIGLPLRRREECPACRAELHVCRMCQFWDPRITKQCRQDDAEEVRNKEQANFCDYFRPRPAAFDEAGASAEQRAKQELDALFGKTDGNSAADPDALFRPRW